MILAAGLGTRLRPITNKIPKALVEINGVTLLEILIKKLIKFHITDIIVNTHHHAEQIEEFLKKKINFGINVEISNEIDLLDTGGGIKKASWFFNNQESFIVHNVDIISDIDFRDLIDFHNSSKALATLAVSKRESDRYFLFDSNDTLAGWMNVKTGEKIISRDISKGIDQYAFSGIHIVSPIIFDHFDKEEAFSIIKTYLRLAKSFKINAYKFKSDNWFDVGNIDDLNYIRQAVDKIHLS